MSLRIWEPCHWIISRLLWTLPPMMQSHILLMCLAFSSFACLFIYCISVLVKCWLLFYYYSSLNELNSFMKYMKRRNKWANWKIWYLVSGFFVCCCFLPQDFLPNSFLLETTLSLGLQLLGTELWTWICVSSWISIYLALNFYQLEVSLIDRGLELSLLAYFIDYITSPFLYFAFCFCLLVGFDLNFVDFWGQELTKIVFIRESLYSVVNLKYMP